ncbi:hypothetical protein Sjap_013063 [Stephania japonica]|uniref:Uncharacterized protein n=1 Tax=Stephania japonica TaxID=461633 RepID=A0AAP0P0Z3_9MAGN
MIKFYSTGVGTIFSPFLPPSPFKFSISVSVVENPIHTGIPAPVASTENQQCNSPITNIYLWNN